MNGKICHSDVKSWRTERVLLQYSLFKSSLLINGTKWTHTSI
uniref:Uncharacterized protein n=1 Tax=Anguilla anguilla TaxID=7936 RepID=A0A0E9UHY2_ANGAN